MLDVDLERQTTLMQNQTELATAQNTLLASQNTLLEQQNLLSESARRAALLQMVGDVLNSIDASIKEGSTQETVTGTVLVPTLNGSNAKMVERADQRKYQVASPRLIGRLAAACSSLRGYRYLGDDGKPIGEPRSPERGFVLRSLVAAGIDISGLLDQRTDDRAPGRARPR